MTGFVYYLAALGAILSASLILPMLVAFGTGAADLAIQFLFYGALGGFFCIATLLAISGRPIGIDRRSATFLVVFSWIFFPVVVAIPLTSLTDLTFTQALFQSVASITTTGSMVFGNLETVPQSVIFFLAQLQWLGGLATLITFILVLSPWEIGGLPKVGSVSETASIVASEYRLTRFCGRLFRALLALTLICFVLLLMAGVSPYVSIILSFSALSTGGIVPVTENLDLVLGDVGMLIMTVFLLFGATSIFWHRYIFNVNLQELVRHRESYFILAVWAGLALVLAYRLLEVSGAGSNLTAMRFLSEGSLNAASVISTSGIQSRPGVFTLLAPTLVLLIVVIGAGCFSTAGGIKFYRIGGVFSHAEHELNRLIYPNSVQSSRFGGIELNLDFMKGIWGFFAVWIISLGLVTFLLTVSGLNFQSGFTAAVAAFSNAGPVYGPFWDTTDTDAWPAYSDMNAFQLSLLTIGMILGRLEIMVLFACFALFFRNFR